MVSHFSEVVAHLASSWVWRHLGRMTLLAVVAWLARVKGIRRGWRDQAADGLSTTYLEEVLDPDATRNGVLCQVRAGRLQNTDARETGYVRHEILRDDITTIAATFAALRTRTLVGL